MCVAPLPARDFCFLLLASLCGDMLSLSPVRSCPTRPNPTRRVPSPLSLALVVAILVTCRGGIAVARICARLPSLGGGNRVAGCDPSGSSVVSRLLLRRVAPNTTCTTAVADTLIFCTVKAGGGGAGGDGGGEGLRRGAIASRPSAPSSADAWLSLDCESAAAAGAATARSVATSAAASSDDVLALRTSPSSGIVPSPSRPLSQEVSSRSLLPRYEEWYEECWCLLKNDGSGAPVSVRRRTGACSWMKPSCNAASAAAAPGLYGLA
mmetsp:Transcript_37399/g.94868  ORF Transcript_37399/g.94868 Transcript_37399/m.94868 type:complete len:266 (+) Transcript_37399:900-1697(+)